MTEPTKLFDPENYEMKKQHAIYRLKSWATYYRSGKARLPMLKTKTSSIGQMAAESVSAKRNGIGFIKYLVWLCKDCDALHTNAKPTICKKCAGERFSQCRVPSIAGKRVYASMIHDTSDQQKNLLDIETDVAIEKMDALLRAVVFAEYLNDSSNQEEKAEDLEIKKTTYKNLVKRVHDYLIGYFDSKLI